MLDPTKTSPKTKNCSSDKKVEESAPIDNNPIVWQLLKIQMHVNGLTFGIFFATGLFLVTIWLLILGGENVGETLSLLRYYMPGYSVTILGCLIGALYGLFYGYLFGFSTAYIYDKIVNIQKKR